MSVIGVYQMKNFSPCKRERSLAYPRKNSVTDTRLSGLSLLSVVVAERIVRSYFVDRNRNNDMIDSQVDSGTRVHRVKDVSPTTQILTTKIGDCANLATTKTMNFSTVNCPLSRVRAD